MKHVTTNQPARLEPERAQTPDVIHEPSEVGYVDKMFLQSFLPYRKTGDKLHQFSYGRWPRYQLTVLGTSGLPYGKYPRLILAYVMTEAVKRHHMGMPNDLARRVPLGSCLADFQTLIGQVSRGSGGANGTISRIKEQIRLLASTVFVVEEISATREREQYDAQTVRFAEHYDLWFHKQDANQPTMTESVFVLSEEFFNRLIESPVPIDFDILRELPPRAMDFYVFLTFAKAAGGRGLIQQRTVLWEELMTKFAVKSVATRDQRKNFKKELQKSLDKIRELWPEVGAELTTEGLVIHPGKPSVPLKPAKRLTR